LRARRAMVAPPPAPRTGEPTDPTDPVGAIEAYRASPSPETATDLWKTSRWNPRDVAIRAVLLEALAVDDWRRRNVQTELAVLAGDRDLERAHAALRALR
ncbi:MAG: hypothetical protein M3619_33970, partial [Myxococcota bacterium]|nr:hypothetical protein [Myxococcota bacterium]